MIVTSFAPAKINLYLHVAAPRADGLHPLDSLVVFAADVGDAVSATDADGVTLDVSGPFASALSHEPNNLVLRAARHLAEHAGITPRAALQLDKQLPIASGIGGGSSDAAAVLRLLNRLWRVNASNDELEDLARALGADVPACVRARTTRMHGIGEALAPMAAPTFDAVLVNPLQAAPTGQVYRAFDAAGAFGVLDDRGAAPQDADDAIAWLAACRSDLEIAAQQVAPAVTDALAVMTRAAAPGALVRMSGSGATCFALVDGAVAASAMAQAVLAARPGWWVRTARLGKVDVGVVEG